ncbi:MAG TPA: metallophosphoesterase [Nannocystaceae bacterium]|nr:metallophosphoesterase [Nannocystaceae bacterium]
MPRVTICTPLVLALACYTGGGATPMATSEGGGSSTTKSGGAADGSVGSSDAQTTAPGTTTSTASADEGEASTAAGDESTDTGVQPPAPFAFLVYGDSRAGGGCEGNAAHLGLVERMVAERGWDFVVHLGDMTTGYDASTCFTHEGDCSDPAEHGNFAQQIAPLLAKAAPPGLPSAFIPVVGNHDDNEEWTPDACGDRMCDIFDLGVYLDHATPNDDPCGADFPDQIYYSFRHHRVLFVVLRINSDYFDLFECNGVEDGYDDCADYCANAPASPTRNDSCYNVHQYDWLREVLTSAAGDPEVAHRVVLLHAPLYTSYDDHTPTTSFGALVPLFEEHGVDYVFNGHNHTYERTVAIRGDVEADDGVVYVTTGHGGSEGGPPLGAWFTAASSGEYHYVRVDVDDAGLHGTVIDVAGHTIDAF